MSILATFSFATGMLCWVLAFPFARIWITEWKTVSHREKIRILLWTAFYLGCAVATLSFYFWDYSKPGRHPEFSVVFLNPALGLQFFAAWVGAPFAFYLKPSLPAATVVGVGLLCAIFAVLVLVALQMKRSSDGALPLAYSPWLCLLAYRAITGLATTAGRAGNC